LPKCSRIRAVHWPSKFALVMATMPRRRKYQAAGRMRPCQKAMIGWRPEAMMAS
jgi:hypothetical protein